MTAVALCQELMYFYKYSSVFRGYRCPDVIRETASDYYSTVQYQLAEETNREWQLLPWI